MSILKQHIFRLIAIVTLAFAGLPAMQAGATGIEMVLCTPDGTKTVTMPGSEAPAQNHGCSDCCCTAIGGPLPHCLALLRTASLNLPDFPNQRRQTTALFAQAIPPRGPPLTV